MQRSSYRNSVLVREDLKNIASLQHRDKIACVWICNSIFIQSILVFVGAATIGLCIWSPEYCQYDYDKLVRIMYLYDPHACGYKLRLIQAMTTLQLKNDTKRLAIRPIKWKTPDMTVPTKLSAKTRKYINLSVFVHILWTLFAISLRIVMLTKNLRLFKFILTYTFYYSVSVVIFDLSMAIVYIAYIQKSLTKGMILRYSGWSLEMTLSRYDDFGGWLPIVASICWMRGIIILALNIYCCRLLKLIRGRLKKREARKKIPLLENQPIPEAKVMVPIADEVLYFRAGEHKPATKRTYGAIFSFFMND